MDSRSTLRMWRLFDVEGLFSPQLLWCSSVELAIRDVQREGISGLSSIDELLLDQLDPQEEMDSGVKPQEPQTKRWCTIQ